MSKQRAFTLVEFLVTVSVIGILSALLLPAVGKAKAFGQAGYCLNNLKQLQACWLMYVNDHNDRLPANDSYQVDGVWRSTVDSWIGNSSAPNDQDFEPIQKGLLYAYDYNRAVGIYHCPSDRSKANGTALLRTRSYSMQARLRSKGTNDLQRLNEIQEPGPSQVFVFLDENEHSIDDAHFLVWYAPDRRWVNLPADRHNRGAVFSFADGHAEHWSWKWKKDFKKRDSYYKTAENDADRQDLIRLQRANPRNRDGAEIF